MSEFIQHTDRSLGESAANGLSWDPRKPPERPSLVSTALDHTWPLDAALATEANGNTLTAWSWVLSEIMAAQGSNQHSIDARELLPWCLHCVIRDGHWIHKWHMTGRRYLIHLVSCAQRDLSQQLIPHSWNVRNMETWGQHLCRGHSGKFCCLSGPGSQYAGFLVSKCSSWPRKSLVFSSCGPWAEVPATPSVPSSGSSQVWLGGCPRPSPSTGSEAGRYPRPWTCLCPPSVRVLTPQLAGKRCVPHHQDRRVLKPGKSLFPLLRPSKPRQPQRLGYRDWGDAS